MDRKQERQESKRTHPSGATHSDVEKGVRREALREGRGVAVLDWSLYMNRSRAMDLKGENRTVATTVYYQPRQT